MTEFIVLAKNAKDISGQRFGRLIALGPTDRNKKKIMWLCQCDCGNTTIVGSDNLRRGITQSCGCLQKERSSEASIVHGLAKHPLHGVWRTIIARCTNPNLRSYARWGGRGITVCDEWQHDFQAFYDHVTHLPLFGTPGYTLDRVDNMQGYRPGNMRWATPTDQARNRRSNHLVTFNGKTQCLQAWADDLGLSRFALRDRISRYGWPIERALTTPVRKQRAT